MSLRRAVGIVCRMAVTIVFVAVLVGAGKYFISSGYPAWFLVVLVPLTLIGVALSVIALVLGLVLIEIEVLGPFKHVVVTRYGIKTTGTVVSSFDCSDPEDSCMCGSYKFSDLRGQDYEFKFKICIHWPSNEQWKLIKQGYSEGAQNPVYYLRFLPFVHEIQFPI